MIAQITIASQTANAVKTLAMADQLTTALQEVLKKRGVDASVSNAVEASGGHEHGRVTFEINSRTVINDTEIASYFQEAIGKIGGKHNRTEFS